MLQERVRVGVAGYGVVGKRVADAVTLQDDTELVGMVGCTPRSVSGQQQGAV